MHHSHSGRGLEEWRGVFFGGGGGLSRKITVGYAPDPHSTFPRPHPSTSLHIFYLSKLLMLIVHQVEREGGVRDVLWHSFTDSDTNPKPYS